VKAALEKHRYARQQLWKAVDALVSDGSIKERLGYAHRHLAVLQPDDLPEDVRERFRILMETLAGKLEHFTYKPSIIRMRKPQSGKIAEEILSIFVKLQGGL
jgi:hypothetical protein